jgi:50S ribosome-binding GTPase
MTQLGLLLWIKHRPLSTTAYQCAVRLSGRRPCRYDNVNMNQKRMGLIRDSSQPLLRSLPSPYRPIQIPLSLLHRFATSTSDNINNESDHDDPVTAPKPRKTMGAKRKFRIAEEITDANMDKLAAAFDDLARTEGFDDSMQYYADDATFEDDFDDDDFMDDLDTSAKPDVRASILDSKQFSLADFMDDDAPAVNDKRTTMDRTGAVGYSNELDSMDNNDSDDEDMDARIAAARTDMVRGRVPIPKPFDRMPVASSELGFRYEADRYYGGVDEGGPLTESSSSRPREFQLVTDALVCSACGADFQSSNERKPGYLPAEKFAIQVKLGQLEELQRLQLKAESDAADWSAEDEIEWLIQTASNKNAGATVTGSDDSSTAVAAEMDIPALAESMGLDMAELARKKTICKRCHGLQNFGKVDNVLRPGWTPEPLLSQEKFRDLLRPIREKPAVIIALVDLFDFAGSVLPELDTIAGDNPVILAANKADLLPAKMGPVRVENWVRRELEHLGIQSLANMRGSVRLVSCKTGVGVGALLTKARKLADQIDGDIYVVGAANAGKSTLLNQILDHQDEDDGVKHGKLRAGNQNKRKGAVTTSPLPGTTLKFIKVDLGGGRSLYDTPGLLVPGTLTQLLTPEELKIVVPKKYVPVRVAV